MDIDQVRGLTDAELATELTAARRQLYDLRFQLATRQLNDYSQIPQTRRTIARILTVITERQLPETQAERSSASRTTVRARLGRAARSGAAR